VGTLELRADICEFLVDPPFLELFCPGIPDVRDEGCQAAHRGHVVSEENNRDVGPLALPALRIVVARCTGGNRCTETGEVGSLAKTPFVEVVT